MSDRRVQISIYDVTFVIHVTLPVMFYCWDACLYKWRMYAHTWFKLGERHIDACVFHYIIFLRSLICFIINCRFLYNLFQFLKNNFSKSNRKTIVNVKIQLQIIAKDLNNCTVWLIIWNIEREPKKILNM